MKLTTCPVCKGKLQIKEYQCDKCNLTFRGEFGESFFANLSKEQMEFIKTFVIVQGNIKEMEKRLNISYPTVKNRLSEIIRAFGHKPDVSVDYTDVFNDLEEGFVSVEEAIALIETRRKNK
ncbi:MAG: DUF2089 domain-containing protein [Candidatus Cloacimonetes bacterium]|nr:DUF2089 domain-containing protein [Candidatus Cloacimonadota bacterium]